MVNIFPFKAEYFPLISSFYVEETEKEVYPPPKHSFQFFYIFFLKSIYLLQYFKTTCLQKHTHGVNICLFLGIHGNDGVVIIP